MPVAASSLGQEAGRIAHTTTWSLAGDSEMVGKRELVTETCKDPQYQMWYGETAGEPVLTGKATAMFHWSSVESCGMFWHHIWWMIA